MTISENFKKYFYNTGWLFAEKSVYLLAGFIIGIFVARYLGPSDFGILNYAISFVLLFGMFASFGMDFIVVRELISRKEDRALQMVFSDILLYTPPKRQKPTCSRERGGTLCSLFPFLMIAELPR